MISAYFSTMLGSLFSAYGQPPEIPYTEWWEQYKSAFIQDDGRVIDKRQNHISHSEGQGYGMLISLLYDDRAAFDKIWSWTKNNLQVRKDNLFAWNWGKRQDEKWGVIDYNNAADGDILIAYALVRASGKWNDEGYKKEGLKIIEGVRNNLSIKWRDRIFILPAYYGFTKEDGIVLNPSYLIFPAYRIFSEVEDKVFWNKVYEDSLFLIEQGRFGKFGLPPDWITLSGSGISINSERNPVFGYEAIRVFLYLLEEKNPKFPAGIDEILRIYEKSGYIPAYIDLSNDAISPDAAPAGFYAIYAAAAGKKGRVILSRKLLKEAVEKAADERDEYYSMSLLLLAIKNTVQQK